MNLIKHKSEISLHEKAKSGVNKDDLPERLK